MVSFMHWVSAAKWIGTVTGMAGAMVIALNFGFVIYGFYLYPHILNPLERSRLGAARAKSICAAGRLHRHQPSRDLQMARTLMS
jgi:hypothetical protein